MSKYKKTYEERVAAYDAKQKKDDDTTKLSPTARKFLARKKWLNTEVAPGVTNKDLIAQTKSATSLKYGESEQALGQSLQQNTQLARRTSDWYAQYQAAIQKAAGGAQAATQNAVSGVQGLQAGLDSAAKTQWAGQQGQMASDAASRGATVDPTLAGKAHNASDVRNALTNSYGAMLLSQGTNTQTGLQERGATAAQQGLGALQGVAAQRGELLGEKRRLKRDKGNFKLTYKQQIISDAGDAYLKKVLAASQLGETAAKTAKTKADTKKSQADTAAKLAETAFFNAYGYKPGPKPSALEQAKLDFFYENGYFPRTGKEPTPKPPAKPTPTSGPGSLTRAEEQKRISQVRTVASFFRNGVVIKDSYGMVQRKLKPGDVDAIRKYLLSEKGLNPLAVNVGFNLYDNHGKLDTAGIKAARKYGLHVKGNFGRVPTGTGAIPGVSQV